MTSKELVDIISGNLKILDSSINVGAGEIYVAGNLAQDFLLMETRCLERDGALTLRNGVAKYEFEVQTIADATNATPIVVEITDHPYATGDIVNIYDVLGNTAANGRWVITVIDADTFSLDDSVGSGAYTNGGVCYHDMMSAYELKHIFFTDAPGGVIEIADVEEVEYQREDYTQPGSADYSRTDIIKLYQVFGQDAVKLSLLGTPAADAKTTVIYIRIPNDSEQISVTVDPIIPRIAKHALIQGTMYYALENIVNNERARKESEKYYQLFIGALKDVKRFNSRRRFNRRTRPDKLEW